MTKGMILAGGTGKRLYPLTATTNKHLLPVYDKPMIYYPLTTLMLGGVRDVLIISSPKDLPKFQDLLGDGSQWGINLSYAEQRHPGGVPEAFLIGDRFIDGEPICLILGDNIFFGHGLSRMVADAAKISKGAMVFAQYVSNPERFGIVEFDTSGQVISIEEKPTAPRSNYAITGLYFYDGEVVEIAKTLTPSTRGELEISDLNNIYHQQGRLKVEVLGRGFAWFDAGTPQALASVTQYVHAVESRQNTRIACPEEVAFRMNFIGREELTRLIKPIESTPYGQYLVALALQADVERALR